MKKLIELFRIRREEQIPALVALVYAVVLNWLVVEKYFSLFTQTGHGRWGIFIKNFAVSGFDPITYAVVTVWDTSYNVYRHPLLAFMVWPLTQLNDLLTTLTGHNLAQIVVALPLVFCAVYSVIFLLRILTEIVRAPRFEACALTAIFFSSAYIMVSVSVPDHFSISMFLLLLTIYICGRKLKDGCRLTGVQTWVLFLLTAGVTLSNGCKTFLYALFTNGRSFFRPKYMFGAVLLPALLIWGFARWEYKTFVLPGEKARHEAKMKKNEDARHKAFIAFMDTTSIKDTTMAGKAFAELMKKKAVDKYRADHKQPWNQHTGKPMAKGEFMNWTDISTSRWQTAVENLFGESVQLHPDHLLEDTLRSRPVIVHYRWAWNYIAEALIVLLFAAGVWCGRRSRFMWMVLSGFAFDIALHMGLGFGINEVYIMAAHWLFALPVAAAYLTAGKMAPRLRLALRAGLAAMAVYLFIYNYILYAGYLL